MTTLINSLKPHIEAVDKQFVALFQSANPIMNEVATHLLNVRGKQIRMLMTLLSAEALGGITDATHRSAALIEALHLSTLLHDDVIDHATMRRHQTTVNARWDNATAILTGDFIYARCLQTALQYKDYNAMEHISKAVTEMSDGELLQKYHTKDFTMTEAVYMDIIRKKTAALFAASCVCGAISVNATMQSQRQFYNAGLQLGIAFQIYDDLLDIMPEAHTGKIKDNDLREHKMTLPFIHFAQHGTSQQRQLLEKLIHGDISATDTDRAALLQAVLLTSEGYVRQRIQNHIEQAKTILINYPKERLCMLFEFSCRS
ncbi:octaprenyl-diphosphate synthase [Bacteroidia bacterium]|nr:octaprenyl-diphosphate synthase [Bacteroidia bacterium]